MNDALGKDSALLDWTRPGKTWANEMEWNEINGVLDHDSAPQGYWATENLGTVSLKLLGGKLAPKLVYFVLRTELLNL